MEEGKSSWSIEPSPKPIVIDVEQIVPLLARQSFHLPGNDWWADWRQWFGNNHIFFGICFHHPFHPVEWWERLLALAASVSFSLIATNVVWQLHRHNPEQMEAEILSFAGYAITYGMVLLWTFGGLCHSIFDMLVWHVQACACCHPGGRYGDSTMSFRCRDVGSYLLIPIILALLGLAVYLILLRASKQGDGEDFSIFNYYDMYKNDDDAVEDQDDLHVDVDNIKGAESFSFLLFSTTELILAWFVYFPIIYTILFSGILGCNGRIPVLGGRPRDLRLVQEEQRHSEYSQM